MSNSRHFALRSAIAQLMRQSQPVAAAVFENRDFTMDASVASQVHVNFADSDPDVSELYTGKPVDWTTSFEVVIKARKAASDEADKVADAIWCDVYSRLFAEPSIGGLVSLLTAGRAVLDTDEADASVARITWTFTAVHRTDANVIT